MLQFTDTDTNSAMKTLQLIPCNHSTIYSYVSLYSLMFTGHMLVKHFRKVRFELLLYKFAADLANLQLPLTLFPFPDLAKDTDTDADTLSVSEMDMYVAQNSYKLQ